MFKECPKLEEHRQYLARTHHMSSDWWRQQPRCTAKSGWIVKGAAETAEARAHCAVAACKLGIAIVNAGNFEGPNYSQAGGAGVIGSGADPP